MTRTRRTPFSLPLVVLCAFAGIERPAWAQGTVADYQPSYTPYKLPFNTIEFTDKERKLQPG